MGWDGPILTDSGGFQVFSLGALRKISEEGVSFQSPINGDRLFLTPEESMRIQHVLNSDIVMIFDECTPYPATHAEAATSMRLSQRWARRSRDAARPAGEHQRAVRHRPGRHVRRSPRRIAGRAGRHRLRRLRHRRTVGRRAEGTDMARILAHTAPRLPQHKPRYLMGVGTPEDLVAAVQPASTCSTA
jgi:queuine tRNA-ribosyltransferase